MSKNKRILLGSLGIVFVFCFAKYIITENTSIETANSIYNVAYKFKTLDKLKDNKPTKIVCYGDSITYGYVGNGEPDYDIHSNQVDNPYPKELENIIRKDSINNNISIVNSGRGGWQSDEGVSGLNQYVLSYNPDLVIIMFGVNDIYEGLYGDQITMDQYKSNLTSMIKTLVDKNIEVLLLSPAPTANESTNKALAAYILSSEQVADDNNIAFIDMKKAINNYYIDKSETQDTMFSKDKTHFAVDKYKYIADIVFKAIIKGNI